MMTGLVTVPPGGMVMAGPLGIGAALVGMGRWCG